MSFDATKPRRIRLLSADPLFYQAGKAVLADLGFEILDSLEDSLKEDALLSDSFFFHAGLGDYLRETGLDTPVILVTDQTGSRSAMGNSPDETLVLPTGWKKKDRRAALRHSFSQSKYLKLLRPDRPDFGSGLWTFLMRQWQGPPPEKFMKCAFDL